MAIRVSFARLSAAGALVLALGPAWARGATRPITDADLFRFVWIATADIAGRAPRRVRAVTVSEKKDGVR